MPRGVYDRSKKKAASGPAVKKTAGKPGPKPGPKKGFKKVAKTASGTAHAVQASSGDFQTLQNYLSVLNNTAQGSKSKIVQEAIDSTVARLERIAEGIVPLTAPAVDLSNGETAAAPVADAPAKKRPGPKPGFKKNKTTKEAATAAPAAPANGSVAPAPFNPPPAPARPSV